MTDTFQPKATEVRAKQFSGDEAGAADVQTWLGDAFSVSLVKPMKAGLPTFISISGGTPPVNVPAVGGQWLVFESSGLRALSDEAFTAVYEQKAS